MTVKMSPLVPEHPLNGFFNARSVAIIGASADPDKLGGKPIRYFRDAGYQGQIYPVNSKSSEIQGFPAFASVTAIPGPVDHAMIILPAKACLPALQECAKKGIRFVQVLSSGFGEAGEEGQRMQDDLVAFARAHGIRLLGPNCLGLVSVRDRFYATFSTALEALSPQPGGIAVATQSGAFGSCTYAMAIQRGLGLSRIVATGNEADTDVAECIDFLVDDPETKVICAALEGCGNGDRLRAALRKAAARNKPVVIMKVGTTEIGMQAAATHTGSLAGNDAVFDTVFAECGAWRANSIEEMLDVAEFCLVAPPPGNQRATIVTVSGGLGILMADAAERFNLTLPPVEDGLAEKLRAVLPFAPVGNPYDTTAQVGAVQGGLPGVIETMLRETDCSTMLVFIAQLACAVDKFEPTRQEFVRLRKAFSDRVLVLVGPTDAKLRQSMIDDGLMVFTDATRAMAAAGAVATMQARRRAMREAEDVQSRPSKPSGKVSASAIRHEADAKSALMAYGIPVLQERVCETADQAVAAAREVGLPVVAKILSPDIAHKTEIGGVILNLSTESEVASAFDTLLHRAKTSVPGARIEGVLIAPMAGQGVETILGVHMDPVFGPMIMFGLGGVAVELYKDIAFASAPLSEAQAFALVEGVRASKLLSGWRGQPALDVQSLVKALVSLSNFAVDHADTLEGVDINPFLVRQQGGVCLDALVSFKV